MKPHSCLRMSSPSKRLGATAVEFALVAPLFFMLIFAILEFGRFMMLRNTADNAAYEGARVAMSHGSSAQAGQDAAELLMQSIGAQNVTTTVTPNVIDENTPAVNVTVSLPFNDNAYLPPLFANGATITGSCTLACEGFRITRMTNVNQ